MKMMLHFLNFRDLGGIPSREGVTQKGMFFRSGKLSTLSKKECARLLTAYNIRCVIDLRTPIEAAEYPDPLPDGVEYIQIPLIKDATVGISHETGSDAMSIIKSLRKNPEKLKAMVPDFKELYRMIATDDHCKLQIAKAVDKLLYNAEHGIPTLFHCTAGKDRTGIISMALLKHYGVAEKLIIKDFVRTNRSAFLPTLKKCVGVWLLTQSLDLVKICYSSFMADRELIKIAIDNYEETI